MTDINTEMLATLRKLKEHIFLGARSSDIRRAVVILDAAIAKATAAPHTAAEIEALIEHAELVMGNEKAVAAGCKMVMRRMVTALASLSRERDKWELEALCLGDAHRTARDEIASLSKKLEELNAKIS